MMVWNAPSCSLRAARRPGTRRIALAAALLATAVLGACGTPAVQDREERLSAAGFRVKLADTPQKLATIQSLPRDRFLQQTVNGQPVYLLGDPVGCKCLYHGNASAYEAFRKAYTEQQLFGSSDLTVPPGSAPTWDFGPWEGPWN